MTEISPSQLLRSKWLKGDGAKVIYVSYRSGEFALKSNVADVAVLARYGQVFGVEKKGELVGVRLAVSIRAAFRTLNLCRAGSEARPLGITAKRSTGLRYDSGAIDVRHVDLGITGSYRRVSIGPTVREVAI